MKERTLTPVIRVSLKQQPDAGMTIYKESANDGDTYFAYQDKADGLVAVFFHSKDTNFLTPMLLVGGQHDEQYMAGVSFALQLVEQHLGWSEQTPNFGDNYNVEYPAK